ncbi:hypothetical protein HD593_001976 [Nonomuraea rubra]|uniref:Uncharacterized protein n=1 Tax=Nonomuraea rubra TaxID=46180 RepID=A0A7X0NPH2_9ACTN|nr:hypothetical protein [Nonomuraea rubra]
MSIPYLAQPGQQQKLEWLGGGRESAHHPISRGPQNEPHP